MLYGIASRRCRGALERGLLSARVRDPLALQRVVFEGDHVLGVFFSPFSPLP